MFSLSLDYEVVDVYSAIDDPKYLPDGVHPNKEGYTIISKLIFDLLQRNAED